jgi:hypothetical protein
MRWTKHLQLLDELEKEQPCYFVGSYSNHKIKIDYSKYSKEWRVSILNNYVTTTRKGYATHIEAMKMEAEEIYQRVCIQLYLELNVRL